jgi:hypothetical protein
MKDGVPLDSLAATLMTGGTYEAIAVVRNEHEADGTAFVANERFIETHGAQRKWRLPPGRHDPFIDDPVGRYEFWLEIRSKKKRWRSEHYYVVRVHPPGQNNDSFRLTTERPPGA